MKNCFVFVVIISLLCSCVSKPRYNALEKEKEELEEQVETLKEQIETLEEEKEDLEEQVEALNEQVEALNEQVETLEDIIVRAKRQCILWDDDTFMALRVLNEY